MYFDSWFQELSLWSAHAEAEASWFATSWKHVAEKSSQFMGKVLLLGSWVRELCWGVGDQRSVIKLMVTPPPPPDLARSVQGQPASYFLIEWNIDSRFNSHRKGNIIFRSASLHSLFQHRWSSALKSSRVGSTTQQKTQPSLSRLYGSTKQGRIFKDAQVFLLTWSCGKHRYGRICSGSPY